MTPKQPAKSARLKPWLWFVLIWLLSVGALSIVAWILRWAIKG